MERDGLVIVLTKIEDSHYWIVVSIRPVEIGWGVSSLLLRPSM